MLPRAADIKLPGNQREMDCQGTRLMIINYCQRCSVRKELRCQVRSRHTFSGLSLYHYDDLSSKLEVHHGILTMNI